MNTLSPKSPGKSRLAPILRTLKRKHGWEPKYEDPFFEDILKAGFNAATVLAAFVLAQIVEDLGPITVRGAFYRAVSAGLFPGTDHKHYGAAQRMILKLRRCDCVSYGKIVDSTRRRFRPSSWNGISDFMETVASAYRLDFWTRQKTHVEVFVEKDAMSGVLEPVTKELNVNLNVTRGFCSETMVMDIAQCWNQITKPIQVYYLGDHDPAGLDIERDLRKKLSQMCGRAFDWERLAVTAQDFFDTEVIGFPVKKAAARIKWEPYVNQFGDRCVEVDAINPGDIRDRLKAAIESHIDMAEWERLRQIEELERQSVQQFVLAQKGAT
jgi:hypothetical protein